MIKFFFILLFSLTASAQLTSKNTAITGSITAANPSVSQTGVTKPSYATFLGVDYLGNLIGVSGTANGSVMVSGTVSQNGTWNVSLTGTNIVSSTGNVPVNIVNIPNVSTTGTIPAYLFAASGTQVTARALNNQVTGTDGGLVVNSVIHGLTTAGGGTYVDVKVDPSGALASSGTVTLNGLLPAFAATPTVSAGTVPVTGTFWQATQPVSVASTLAVSAGTVAITSANTLSVSAGTLSVTFPSAQSVSSVGTVQVSGTVLPNGVFTVSAGTVGITAASTLAVSAGQVTVLQGTNPWTVSGSVSLNGTQPVSATIGNTVNVATHAVTQSGAWSQSILNSIGIASGTLTGITNTVGVSAGTVAITAASPLSVSAGTVSVTFPSAQQVSAGTVAITAASTLSVSAGQITVLQGTSPWTVSGSVSLNGTQPVSSVGTVVVSATGTAWASAAPNATSTNALTKSVNANTSKVAVKASAGRVYQVFGFNNNSGCGWIHIFDSAAQPVANTAPTLAIPVCQNQAFSSDFALPYGMYMTNGIYVGMSTSMTAWVNTTGNSNTTINALYQ